MTKSIRELNKEELTKVFNSNEKLKNEIMDDMLDSEMLFIGDWFNGMRGYLSSYEYGLYCRGEHITVRNDNEEKFILYLESVDDDYCIFKPEDKENILKAKRFIGIMNKCNSYSDRYYKFQEKLDSLINDITYSILEFINNNLESCCEEKNQLEYFLDFYYEERMDDSYFIDKDFILYETIVKSYN